MLLEVDAGNGRPADVARLAELVVDPVDTRVGGAALAELEAARELGVDRLGEPLDLLRREIPRERVRRELGVVENLVRPGAADPGDRPLVAQQRVQPA